jgi:hypothetical protein
VQSSSALVNQLHTEYCARSGMDTDLTMNREAQWGYWLAHRTSKPFTVEDLRRVIAFLRRQVSREGWSIGCLYFKNVIGDPEKFEEHLSAALATNASAASVTTPRKRSTPSNDVPLDQRPSLEEFNAELKKYNLKK